MSWKICIDWDGDGFICHDVQASDALNLIPTPVYLGDVDSKAFNATLTKTVEHSAFGIWRYDCTTTSGTVAGYYLGTDNSSVVDDIAIDASTEYTFAVWLKGTTGKAMKLQAYDQGGSLIAENTSITLTTDYVLQSLTFTTGVGDTHVALRVLKNNDASNHTFYSRGFMLVEGDTAPEAFNAGDSSNAYDSLQNIKEFKWRIGGRPFQVMADETIATIVVDNDTRLYSPDYASGALYGYFKPNRLLVIYYNDTIQFTGLTNTFSPTPFRFETRETTIEAYGFKDALEQQEVPAFLDRNIFPAAAISLNVAKMLGKLTLPVNAYLLDALGATSGVVSDPSTATGTNYYTSDTSVYSINNFGDNLRSDNGQRIDAYKVIASLVEAEQGRLYIDKDGAITFRAHNWLDGVSSGTALEHLVDIDYKSGTDVLFNRVVVKFNPRKTASSTTLCELNTPVPIPNGETRVIRMGYTRYGLPIGANATTPSGGDYTWSAGTPTIDYVTKNAQNIEIGITNNTGSDTNLTALTISGTPIDSASTNEIIVEDEALIADLRLVREMSINLKSVSSYTHAYSLAADMLARFSQSLGVIESVTVEAEDSSTEADTILAHGLGTALEISDYQLGLENSIHHIVGIQGQVKAKGKQLKLKFILEPNYGEAL